MEWNSDRIMPVGLKILFAEKSGQGPHTFWYSLLRNCEEGRDTEPAIAKQMGTVKLRDGLPKWTQCFSLTTRTEPRTEPCSHFWIINVTEIIHLQECSSEPQPAWWLWSTGWGLRAQWQRPPPRHSLPVGYRGGSHPLLSVKRKATQEEKKKKKSRFQYSRTTPREKCLFF